MEKPEFNWIEFSPIYPLAFQVRSGLPQGLVPTFQPEHVFFFFFSLALPQTRLPLFSKILLKNKYHGGSWVQR